MTNLTCRPDAGRGQLVFPAGPPRHHDGTNATIEALRLGIDGVRTDSKASAAAIHIGGYARAGADRALVTECHPALGPIPRVSLNTRIGALAQLMDWSRRMRQILRLCARPDASAGFSDTAGRSGIGPFTSC